jgi:hypothetical protein
MSSIEIEGANPIKKQKTEEIPKLITPATDVVECWTDSPLSICAIIKSYVGLTLAAEVHSKELFSGCVPIRIRSRERQKLGEERPEPFMWFASCGGDINLFDKNCRLIKKFSPRNGFRPAMDVQDSRLLVPFCAYTGGILACASLFIFDVTEPSHSYQVPFDIFFRADAIFLGGGLLLYAGCNEEETKKAKTNEIYIKNYILDTKPELLFSLDSDVLKMGIFHGRVLAFLRSRKIVELDLKRQSVKLLYENFLCPPFDLGFIAVQTGDCYYKTDGDYFAFGVGRFGAGVFNASKFCRWVPSSEPIAILPPNLVVSDLPIDPIYISGHKIYITNIETGSWDIFTQGRMHLVCALHDRVILGDGSDFQIYA